MRRAAVNRTARLRGQTIPQVLIVLVVVAALVCVGRVSQFYLSNPGQLAYNELSGALRGAKSEAQNGATTLTITGKTVTILDVNGAVMTTHILDNAPSFTWTGSSTGASSLSLTLTTNGTAAAQGSASCSGLTVTFGKMSWPITCSPLSM